MFEKEADKYVVTTGNNDCTIDAYIAGAEFAFDKANEWLKADVPTTPINKVVLGYIKDYNSKKFCLVNWNDKVKLIAWKEIVLPKKIKEK